MKKIALLILFSTALAQAQQIPQLSQYLWNSYLVNPAIGGAENYLEWKAGYRNQWVGLEGAPESAYFTMHGQLGKKYMNREDHDVIDRSRHSNPPSKFATFLGFKKKRIPSAPSSFQVKSHHGLGGQILLDRIGPFSTTSAYGSYSFHIPIAREVYISMRASLGLKQYKVNHHLITVRSDNDPLVGQSLTGIVPDGMVGVMAYGNKFYAGASMGQIFNNSFNLAEAKKIVSSNSSLKSHYFAQAGYRFKISNEVAIVPSTMIRVFPSTPVAMDLTCKVNYLDLLWFGASVRIKDALVVMTGVNLKNRVLIGYSYDYTTSQLRKFSQGSHEIIVGYRLINKPLKGCKPSYIW